MEISCQPKTNPLRTFLQLLLDDQDVRIMTIKIEYFRKGNDWKDPVVVQFGHKGALNEI